METDIAGFTPNKKKTDASGGPAYGEIYDISPSCVQTYSDVQLGRSVRFLLVGCRLKEQIHILSASDRREGGVTWTGRGAKSGNYFGGWYNQYEPEGCRKGTFGISRLA